MLFEASIIRLLCAKNYDYQFQFLKVIEDETGYTFLGTRCKTYFVSFFFVFSRI